MGSKMEDVIANMNRRSSAWHNEMDSSAHGDMGRRQPIEVDSAMEGVSKSSVQAPPPPHGAVVDIKLDSELQMLTNKKGVATKGLRFMQAGVRSAPNVETSVAEQQL